MHKSVDEKPYHVSLVFYSPLCISANMCRVRVGSMHHFYVQYQYRLSVVYTKQWRIYDRNLGVGWGVVSYLKKIQRGPTKGAF